MAIASRSRPLVAFRLKRPPSFAARHQAYPYQLEAVRAIQDLPAAAVFHEPGLGKTKICTDLLLLWLNQDRVDTSIVVTKKSLIENWRREVKLHSFVTPWVLSTNRRDNAIALNRPALIYLTNYEVISSNVDLIRAFLRTCRVAAVLDESQKIKNPESKLARDFHSLAPGFERRIIMTGTPVANRPHDIWSQVKFLDDGESLGDSFGQFKADFDLPARRTTVAYGERLSSLWGKIGHFSVRETKESAGIDLPTKTIVNHDVELERRQAEIYSRYRDEMAYEWDDLGALQLDDADDVLKRLLRLVQCASNPALVTAAYREQPGKFATLFALCRECVPSSKLIVWTSFVGNVIWLADELREFGALTLHGRMPMWARDDSISRFLVDDACRVLVATPGAAKEGLTLTVANQAVFYDRSFSLDDYIQAQDRIHRISQTTECTVHNLIARNTIDEWINSLLHAKYLAAQLAQGDIGRGDFERQFSGSLTEELRRVLGRKGVQSDARNGGHDV